MMQGQRVNKTNPFQWVLPVLVAATVIVAVLLLLELLGGKVSQAWAGLANREVAASGLVAAAARPASMYVGPQRNLLQTGSFDSGSDGSDGALNLTGTGIITFSPTAFNPPLDPDGDYIYNFTDIYIGPDVTVVMKPPYLNAPVIWLASGTVQIDGVIDLSGEDGRPYSSVPADRQISIPGAGGYSGGIARWGNDLAQKGLGPGGGCVYNNSPGGGFSGSAGHSTTGDDGSCNIMGNAYGNTFLVPLIGGSGGGGYGGGTTLSRGSGGAGGGAILIASSESISLNGSILSNGGDTVAGDNRAGDGSGGEIRLIAPMIDGIGSLRADGTAGAGSSSGRIRLEAFEQNFTGTVIPSPNLGTPYEVFLPPHPPAQVKVVSVSGVLVPDLPTGNFTAPDVTINATGTTTFQIEARYVPLGSVVQLYAYSENGPDLIVDSTPLVGTIELSTAVMAATLPSGYSRVFVRSDWTP